MASIIKISGMSNIVTSGDLCIKGGIVTVDGKEVADLSKVKLPKIEIVIQGNMQSLSVDSAEQVTVQGAAETVSTISADVKVQGDVRGNVSTVSGDVKAKNIAGNVKTVSGDISI